MQRRPKDPEFVAALRFFMESRDWDEFDLARAAGFSLAPAAIRAWLSGQNEPSNKSVRLLCETFGAPRWFFWYRGHEIQEERRRREAAEAGEGDLGIEIDFASVERLLAIPDPAVRARLFELVDAARS